MRIKKILWMISILSILFLNLLTIIPLNVLASENLQFYSWYKIWDDEGLNYGYSICEGENNSIYISGSSYISNSSEFSPYIIQYDNSGEKLMELKDIPFIGNNLYFRAITIDNKSNIYMAGSKENPITGESDFMLWKLNELNQTEWGTTWGSTGKIEKLYDISLDSSGNVYVVGQASTDNQNWLLKYNENGGYQWSKYWNVYTSHISGKLTIDSADNVYVTGTTGAEMYLTKYNSTGDLEWYENFGAVDQDIHSTDIVVDSLNNIYICGYVNITLPTPGLYTTDVFLAKFNSLGLQLWNKTWGGPSYDEASGIAVDLNDNLYITGSTSSYEYQKLFVLKYNSQGTKKWSNVLNFSVCDSGNDIISDSSGNIYVVGNTFNINDDGDIIIIKMNSIPPPPPIQIPGYDIIPLLIASTISLSIIVVRKIKWNKKNY